MDGNSKMALLFTGFGLSVYPALWVIFQMPADWHPPAFIGFVVLLFAVLLWVLPKTEHWTKRPKPDNYVGRFRRPDGSVVHVARMPSGQLWVASDTQPPEEIGYIDGRELITWTKLGATPDG